MSNDLEHNSANAPQLKRSLENRHLQLIAIGGAIGTGLFMGSGKTISLAGPSILLIYSIIGMITFLVMRALGELLLSNLNYKSFIDLSADLIGPWAGFFVGWTYWFGWIVVGIADLNAIIFYLQFFNGGNEFEILQKVGIITASILFILALNLVAVRLFGELEFWFALVKIIAIVVLIAVGGWMIFTGFTPAMGGPASIDHLWSHGGWFPTGFTGFLAGFQIAIFAFIGVELVGTTAAEAKDPETNLPKAINAIPLRVLLFYVLSLFVVMSVTPWNRIDPNISPFVNLFSQAGVASAAIIMNLVVLSSVMSSMNSGVFSTSRMLFGLANDQQAPNFFAKLNRSAVPSRALFVTAILMFGGVGLQYFVPNTIEAFTLATALSTILFITVWIMFMWSYINYRRLRPELAAHSRFKLPGGLISAAVVIVFLIAVIAILADQPDTKKALLISPFWLVILGVGYFGFYKPSLKKRQ